MHTWTVLTCGCEGCIVWGAGSDYEHEGRSTGLGAGGEGARSGKHMAMDV